MSKREQVDELIKDALGTGYEVNFPPPLVKILQLLAGDAPNVALPAEGAIAVPATAVVAAEAVAEQPAAEQPAAEASAEEQPAQG
jgi:hypothetical protein